MGAQFQVPVRLVVTVPTAGTPVQVNAGAALYVRAFIAQAHYANTGNMLMGDSSAHALAASAHALAPGDNFTYEGSTLNARDVQVDLSSFWFDTTANGGKIIITYFLETLHQ